MRYLILLCSLFIGCSKPAPDNRVSEILSRVQTDNVEQTTVMLDEFGKLNIKLDTVKAAIEAIPAPAGGDLMPPEPPSSPSKAEPQAPPASSSKPILYVSTIKFCRPCRLLEKDIKDGLFNDFDVRIVEDPDWDEGFPVIRWQEGGEWKYFRDPKTKRNIGYGPNVLKLLKDRLLNDGSI